MSAWVYRATATQLRICHKGIAVMNPQLERIKAISNRLASAIGGMVVVILVGGLAG